MSQVRGFPVLRAISCSAQLAWLLVALVMFWPDVARSQDILATNQGVVQTSAGVEQVQCHLIGAGPLRYPPKAKRYKYVGQVVVKFGVDQQGKVTDPYVVASEPPGVFERAALKHVKSYKYKPPLLAGEPTHVDEVAIKLVFNPNKR